MLEIRGSREAGEYINRKQEEVGRKKKEVKREKRNEKGKWAVVSKKEG